MIYSAANIGVTLKSRLSVVQGLENGADRQYVGYDYYRSRATASLFSKFHNYSCLNAFTQHR